MIEETQDTVAPSCGFVFATTGEDYNILARRAARTMRLAMPDVQIDWFTETDCEDPVFDKIHKLEKNWFRPKMESLRRSRFDRTVYLDADMIVLHDISDVFDVLETHDLCGVHGRSRSQVMSPVEEGVPRCAPVINGGFLGVKASPETQAFLTKWQDIVVTTENRFDQTSLRRLVHTTDLRFYALPVEYNVIDLDMLQTWRSLFGAPRVLHVQQLHKQDPGAPESPYDLDISIGGARAHLVRRMKDGDWSLGGDPHMRIGNPLVWSRERNVTLERDLGKTHDLLKAAKEQADALDAQLRASREELVKTRKRLSQAQRHKDAVESELNALRKTRTVVLSRKVNKLIGRG